MSSKQISEVRGALEKFQAGYTARDASGVDAFMQLFAQGEEIEMIGIGAVKRGGAEWFEGLKRIREIIEGDWTYWGNVRLDVEGAKITVCGNSAWISTTGTVTQTEAFDQAIELHLNDMKAMFDRPELNVDEKLMEITHYGMRRLRERSLGVGHEWPFTFTAVLTCDGSEWRFHTIHWAMPVD